MKYTVFLAVTFLLFSCNKNSGTNTSFVQDLTALEKAIEQATPGDEIVLANGSWKDVQIDFYGRGTASQPIILRAENPGKVFLEGKSSLYLGGEYLVVEGLYFRNGYSPRSSIVAFKIGQDSTAFHSRISNCVIEGFTKPSRLINDHWIEFYGQHNQLDHCYIAGKSNDGETLRVFHTGNQNTSNYHQIVNNYFGPRPRKGGPRAETIRIGDSKTHMTPGYVNVADNYFEACNGEVEVISDKTNFNTFRNNIFYKCEGSLVLRHGSFAKVDGNIFIGGDESGFYGGVRVINTGHWITNNYFYKINGEVFRSPLAMMNGIPKSQLNRYRQVTDVVVAHNTWVNCKSPWQVGVGQNIASADVLPEVEIRSAPPIRSIIANNLIYNDQADDSPVVNHSSIDGVLFRNNVLHNDGLTFTKYDALQLQDVKMKQINEWLFAPEEGQSGFIDSLYNGFDFDKIEQDLFGSSRADKNLVGAISQLAKAENYQLDQGRYGPSWFSTNRATAEPAVLTASSKAGELARLLDQAEAGDIIELTDKEYTLNGSLKIDKEIIIRSAGEDKAQLLFSGGESTPAFEMNPKGSLRLKNIRIKGKAGQLAFAPLKENMSSAYKLLVDDCEIEGFSYLLKASKGSFADSITVSNTLIQNCENGFVLAADEKGDYNAEMVSIDKCTFINVQRNVVHFYRGGYDESTIGGFLSITNNNFMNCGAKEESSVLLKTRGIINVFITGNTFRQNPVKLVALLWGEKNNHHRDNTMINSGGIKVEEQQKLEILY
ncbi:chondroitinase-B domain-containing protein [Neolewinella agarilytica]|uniref:chondroitinase-B domain-containing protein n=1 Tax=Neolewinella agarilytica TaxID=478744 RepID=UPI002356C756|nr:chondroitinase-B domain-containing protein [Neolewinella agarilytica]